MTVVDRENKFLVVKLSDLDDYLDYVLKDGKSLNGLSRISCFYGVIRGIQDMRERNGKPRYNSYILCNQNEPYAWRVWETILDGERNKLRKCTKE
jgi:hypothetical protein